MIREVYRNAQYELRGFLIECPAFSSDLFNLILKYLDIDFMKKGFSLKISGLFKTIANSYSKKTYIDIESYQEMQSLVEELRYKHTDYYDIFVTIIRGYAWNRADESIGYCKLARLIIGEPASSVIESNDGLYKFIADKLQG